MVGAFHLRKFLSFLLSMNYINLSVLKIIRILPTRTKCSIPKHGDVSLEGITKDLEAIADAGFSGIRLFHGQFAAFGPEPMSR